MGAQKWPKKTITRKIKIGKIWNLIFHLIQPIPDHSCKFDHFWRTKNYFDVAYLSHAKHWRLVSSGMLLILTCPDYSPPILKKIPSPWTLFVFCLPVIFFLKNAWTFLNNFFFRSYQIYMKDAESAGSEERSNPHARRTILMTEPSSTVLIYRYKYTHKYWLYVYQAIVGHVA